MPACSILTFAGCRKEADAVTLGEWIKELDEQAGISEFKQNQPYFMNVPEESEYYSYVQSAVEWKILDPSYAFDPDAGLTKEWTAYTLMNLAHREQKENQQINDIGTSNFQDQIQMAVASGLMPVDQRGMFHPKEIIDEAEAEHLLEQTVSYANHQTFDTVAPKMEWKDSVNQIDASPEQYHEQTQEGWFAKNSGIKEGDVVHWQDAQGDDCYYTAEEVADEDDSLHVKFHDFNPEESLDSMQLSGRQELDFSKAEISIGDAQITPQASRNETAEDYLSDLSVHPLQKSFRFGDFDITVESSGSYISAKASHTMPHGTEIAAAAVLNHVNVNYAWNSAMHDIRNAYFKIDFDSEEDLSIKNEKTKNLYGDFSKVDSADFLNTLKNLYQEKNDAEETTLTLCKVVLPLPNAPVFNINLNLELHLSATGKAELTLTQQNGIGFETRNGIMRIIKENQGKADATVKATVRLLAGIRFGLSLLNGTLMDAGINAGAEGTVKTTVHLYDSQGNMQNEETDLPGDLADNSADGNPDVLVCTDTNAHWVLNILLNSNASLAGKWGMSKEFDLLGETNAPLIPGLNHHFENGRAVERCTRTSRKSLPTAEGITAAKHICLKKYSFSVKQEQNYQIEIDALPAGYQRSDLLYQSSAADIASVDADGRVHGNAAGSAVITIATKDQKHTIHCNVIVPEN